MRACFLPINSSAFLRHYKTGEEAVASKGLVDDAEAEDVHHFVEKQLVARIGDVGYKLHSGRSRNEQIATDLRLYVRAAIDELRKELAEVCTPFTAGPAHART